MKNKVTKRVPPESETVEWKRSPGEWKEIVETCAAFATSRGGTIHVGIGRNGDRVGVQIGQGTLEDLANKIAQNTNPRQTPSIVTSDSAGKSIIKIAVPASRFKPVYAFDRPFRRSGRTNQRLSIEDATHIYLSSRGLTWDQTPVEGAKIADIDPAAVRRFLQVARTERQWDVRADTPVKQVLRQVGLLVESRVTVAAILLFGRNPYVEQFGTGIQRIVDDCRTHRKPEPVFEIHGQTFRAVFTPAAAVGEALPASAPNSRQKAALDYVHTNGRISRQEYVRLAGCSPATAKRDLSDLIANGLLVRKKSGRLAWYQVSGSRNEPDHEPDKHLTGKE